MSDARRKVLYKFFRELHSATTKRDSARLKHQADLIKLTRRELLWLCRHSRKELKELGVL